MGNAAPCRRIAITLAPVRVRSSVCASVLPARALPGSSSNHSTASCSRIISMDSAMGGWK